MAPNCAATEKVQETSGSANSLVAMATCICMSFDANTLIIANHHHCREYQQPHSHGTQRSLRS